MSEENRIRFAGLMEEYLNIPSFVCELIEKKLEDNKYKEVIKYVVQRRNEIENKEDYLSEQEKIKRYLDLQQKVEQLEKELQITANKCKQLENIRKEAIEYIKNNKETREHYEPYGTPMGNSNYTTTHIFGYYELLDILNKGDNNGK